MRHGLYIMINEFSLFFLAFQRRKINTYGCRSGVGWTQHVSNLWQRRSLGASSFLEYPVGMELAPLHSRGEDSDEDAYALTG